jgi:hypothetical protein
MNNWVLIHFEDKLKQKITCYIIVAKIIEGRSKLSKNSKLLPSIFTRFSVCLLIQSFIFLVNSADKFLFSLETKLRVVIKIKDLFIQLYNFYSHFINTYSINFLLQTAYSQHLPFDMESCTYKTMINKKEGSDRDLMLPKG